MASIPDPRTQIIAICEITSARAQGLSALCDKVSTYDENFLKSDIMEILVSEMKDIIEQIRSNVQDIDNKIRYLD